MRKTINTLATVLLVVAAMITTAFAFTTPDTTIDLPVDTTAVVDEAVATATTNDIVDTTVVDEAVATTTTNDIVDTTETENTHRCAISRATANYHHYSCDECKNYSRVDHDELSMVVAITNEWFHTWNCDCGYMYAEKHDFEIAFDDATAHYEICEDCGYAQSSEEHTLTNYFYGNYHDIECSEYCGYIAAHHIGVKYAPVDAQTCEATCRCGTTEIVEHDFNGFVCENCNYVVSGYTFGIVTRVRYYDDYDRVTLVSGDTTFRIDFDCFDYDEGDFIMIDHYGDVIFNVRCLVDGDLVDFPEPPINVADEVTSQMGYIGYANNTVAEVVSSDESLILIFEDGKMFCFQNYEVYDFVNMEKVDANFICEGERLVWYTFNGVTYILDYYY